MPSVFYAGTADVGPYRDILPLLILDMYVAIFTFKLCIILLLLYYLPTNDGLIMKNIIENALKEVDVV
jgi:hypothetical protein